MLRMPRFPAGAGLWNRQNLITIAGLAGEPLEFDDLTISKDKLICARVKVAVDLSKPLRCPRVPTSGIRASRYGSASCMKTYR